MRYEMENGKATYFDNDGNQIVLTNFEARIKEELIYLDGSKSDRYYEIEGKRQIPGGNELQELENVTIKAEEFASMNWVGNAWGSQAIIFPKPSAKDLLRTIIQLDSRPTLRTIYTHTGWAMIDKHWTYLTNGACITGKKRRTDLSVQLPPDLDCYNLPAEEGNVKEAFLASLGLTRILPPELAWLILAAAYRAALGPCDFAIHMTGRTGTFKSELASIIQSHYGCVNARKLPASWSSTANALEAMAYRAKNTIFVIDDFIPMGTSYQQKSYQKTADQIFRAQGNQSGRARLTDTSNLQQTMYPRGLIFSTGEDTPEGHSVRGRMMIIETEPGEVSPADLTTAQDGRGLYSYSMAAYIQWLAADLETLREDAAAIAEKIRDDNLRIGHPRTPPTLGQLMSGIYLMLRFGLEKDFMSKSDANWYYKHALETLTTTASRQNEYLTAADPCEQFMSCLRAIFAVSAGHIKGIHGGIPRQASVLGWSAVGDEKDMDWKPHGPRLGWADDQTNILYLDAAVVYDTIRRHSRGAITITRQTLYKRLYEAGLLAKRDDSRQRNTVRVQCENAGRVCLALTMSHITEGEPDD